jgi:MFS family permease
VAYPVATVATAFSTGLVDFAPYQLVATVFLTTELSLAQVVIAEEFPPTMRGLGQGILGAFAVCGAGVVAVLFPILQQSAFGWRGMYLIGILPLLVVAYLRRNLPETQRWERAALREAPAARVLDVLRPGLRRSRSPSSPRSPRRPGPRLSVSRPTVPPRCSTGIPAR